MAKVKRTITQRDFTYMELREDFLERDDVDIRGQSLSGALNMKALQTGAMEARPGLHYVRTLPNADDIIEIRPATGLKFGMVIYDDSLQIFDNSGGLVFAETAVPWTDAEEVWSNSFRAKTVIGSEGGGINVLEYDGGVWTFSEFAFSEVSGGELAQPYWSFDGSLTLKPSALSGNITLTASKPFWTDAYVGLRVRYGAREVTVTERVSNTVVRGTVVNGLPPSWYIAVENSTEYRVGDAVVAADTNFQGLIVGINDLILSVVTSEFYEGPDVGEELSGPSGSSEITASVACEAPLASPIWDEPLMSSVRGWPRASGSAAGRMVLLDFPAVPDLIAVSSSRTIEDFDVGADDDDAIVRQVGDNAPRWLHAKSVGDLILFSDNGLYNVPTRENGVITPNNFNPVFIDESGCSTIEPVTVEDGIIFVDGSGENVKMVMLDGNIYLKWSVKPLTPMHRQLVKSPRALCGPSLGSAAPEKYVFIINGDGTLATVTWQSSLRDESVGFAPWVTDGSFVKVSPIFDGYFAIIDREVDGSTVRFLERFDDEMTVDCGVSIVGASQTTPLTVNGDELTVNGVSLGASSPYMTHLAGATVSYYIEGWDAGDFLVNADGTMDNEPDDALTRQVGLNFEAAAQPWPTEYIDNPRGGDLAVRVMGLNVSVQNTLAYQVSCNGITTNVSAYGFGDDLSLPPIPKTEVRQFTVYGNRDHPELIISKKRPGPFRVLAIGQRVQV